MISPLLLVKDEQEEYLEMLREYVGILDEKTNLLSEMQKAKTEIGAVKDKVNEAYGNKDNLSRDKLKEVKEKIPELKINRDEFTEEKVLVVVDAVNGILDGVAEKASVLVDCIDTCYKNRINEVNDELADKIKGFADSVAGLNEGFEKEFNFDKMQEIREGKKEEAENVNEI